ncbi:GNAT family N-acetyltransferase [Rugamonas sp.]|uniref:GNAT family N-acetyltransferase n=1 Tax=Rugamonas sp. TaxID=1926287 RepID=UPI0025E96CD1|nr:GNAT family N-acetyltransferase [Rugamonas sp.]
MNIYQPDLAQYDAARADLIALLMDAVAHGASLGFLAALTPTEAGAYWCEVRAAMQTGARLLWLAERDGAIVGTVQVELCGKKNGVNRAEVQKLLVHSAARRGGVARQLMAAVEAAARALDRGLLYLDTEAGSDAEPFYRACGYTYAAGLPDYACNPSGIWKPNAIYYKTLFTRSPS